MIIGKIWNSNDLSQHKTSFDKEEQNSSKQITFISHRTGSSILNHFQNFIMAQCYKLLEAITPHRPLPSFYRCLPTIGNAISGVDSAFLLTVAEWRKSWWFGNYILQEKLVFFIFFAMENSKWFCLAFLRMFCVILYNIEIWLLQLEALLQSGSAPVYILWSYLIT